MKEIHLTNSDKIVLIDDEDYDKVISLNTFWYLYKGKSGDTIYSTKYNPHFSLSRIIMNLTFNEDGLIDHRDGNIFDCRKFNLRMANYSTNGANRKLNKNNKSGYKGVFIRITKSGIKRYEASIKYKGKREVIGTYSDKILAAIAYDKKAFELFGEYAKLNLPVGEI